VLALAGAAVFGGYLTWQYPDFLPVALNLPGWERPVVAPVPESNETPDAGPRKPAPQADAPAQPPEPEITLQEIEQLLQRTDTRAALIDAQIWQQLLTDHGVPESDSRRRRLAEVIQVLTERLTPKPSPPPAFLAAFRGLVQQLYEALLRENLPAARQAAQGAEALFNKHPKELAPYSPRYLALMAKLRQLELRDEGFRKIEQLLAQAQKLARLSAMREPVRSDEVSAAREAEARAKFLALRTPLNKAEEERLNQRVKELTPDLLFARGHRAVKEATRCLQDGDARTRDLLVLEARTLLPGLPEDRIRDLIEETEKTAKANVARKEGSTFAQAVEFRRLYETALERFAAGEASRTIEACRRAHGQLAALPPPAPEQSRKLADLVWEALEPVVLDRLAAPDTDPELRTRLVEARMLLDQAGPWRADARGQRLDAALRHRGDQLARQALAQADELFRQDRLQEALEAARPAETLGGAEVASRARELARQWQAELGARASRAAQEEHWGRIEHLRREGKPLETWRELRRFAQRFPVSAREDDSKRLEAQLAPSLGAEIEGMLHALNEHVQAEKWVAFRHLYEVLAGGPLPPGYADRLRPFRGTAEGLNRKAEAQFAQLKKLHRFMIDTDSVLQLLDGLPKVLALNPAHEEARAMLEEARRQGQRRGARQLEDLTKRTLKPPRYKERLSEILRLDPDGPSGEKARALLKAP
jgi:hypothetical protein